MADDFAVMMSGQVSFGLDRGSEEEQITRLLSGLDGDDEYSMVLWMLPDGVPFYDFDQDEEHDYIQCAGSFVGRLTSEVREVRGGVARQYVVGRVSDDPGDDAPANEVVPWNGYEARVKTNEVLTGSEVQELFLSYFQRGELPDAYERREIEL